MVEIFRTNIQHKQTADKIRLELLQQFPGCRINFDLDDSDRVLRIESATSIARKIERIVLEKGFRCEELL